MTDSELNEALLDDIRRKLPEAVRLALKQGADANAKDNDGNTPLHFFACVSSDQDIFNHLLEHGARINEKNNDGQTPLHMVALRKDKKSATMLLSAGANPNMQDKTGNAPLHVLLSNPQLSKAIYQHAEALLGAGADILLKNKAGETPAGLIVATQKLPGTLESPESAAQKRLKEQARVLLSKIAMRLTEEPEL